MRFNDLGRVPWLALLVSGALGQRIVDVTDLRIFSSLAPCAASAISLHIMSQTSSNCPQAATELQECVCTKNSQLAAISSAMSLSVSDNCGSTATDDQTSAASVLSAYCAQKTPSAMPTLRPPEFPVSQYITDFVEFEQLAPCASSALSYAVQSMTNTYCPRDPVGLAMCACQRNQNSQSISRVIDSSVRYSCASHSADMTSAQGMFSAYCKMADSGTTAFPVPSPPPGDMSYFVTALPQFKSLASCAQHVVSFAISSQISQYCPQGVQALASCVCIKESMSSSVSSSISSNVKFSCSTTANQDLTSALSVFGFYCSAARGQVKATGISESIAQSYPPAQTGSNSGQPGPGQSGAAGQDGSVDGGSGPNTGIIAGAVVGSVVLLLLTGVAVFFLMRRARLNSPSASKPYGRPTSPEHHYKPEMDGVATQITQLPPAQSPVGNQQRQELPIGSGIVSPLSAGPATSELHGTDSPVSPQTAGYRTYGFQDQNLQMQRSELQGAQPHPGVSSQNSFNVHNGTPANMTWHSGPVPEYSELDGTSNTRGQPEEGRR
ncbi:hypothetical protein PpBr36_08595 [Pyricularia pennisetigena]|uniref:hypothetical protein n=1 Tax=Pyricularia pennisetigena TaxID=1578925 RepID=UPI00114EA889|nr:hypothetical protein PpBr36_08595 [Pyricularia pennisetigena]TLS23962.1 hypothetical protein PpBr36_08595 [Pyricularia pennisetigena]